MLEFNTTSCKPLSAATIAPVDVELLMTRLVVTGCQVVEVDWERIGSLRLSVHDDVVFMCEAYNELQTFAVDGGKQHVYLGDGELELMVMFSGGLGHIVQRFSPYLNRNLVMTCEYVVSIDQYTGAWHRLVRGIEEMITAMDADKWVTKI